MDGSGTKVVEYTYDAWGKLISATGTLANTLGAANPDTITTPKPGCTT